MGRPSMVGATLIESLPRPFLMNSDELFACLFVCFGSRRRRLFPPLASRAPVLFSSNLVCMLADVFVPVAAHLLEYLIGLTTPALAMT